MHNQIIPASVRLMEAGASSRSRYYLETSSLRHAGKRLLHMGAAKDCFTSALSLLELLSDPELRSDDKKFEARASCIKTVLDLRLPVEWTLPKGRTATAFRRLRFDDALAKPFQQIIDCIVCTNSRQEFLSTAGQMHLMQYLKEIEEYDTTLGEFYRDAIKMSTLRQSVCQSARNLYPWMGEVEIKHLTKAFFALMKDPLLAPLNQDITRMAYAMRHAMDCQQDLTTEDIANIYHSYDGSIDLFFRAHSFAAISYEENGLTVGANDAVDLHHFVYLTEGTIFVCEERGKKIMPRVASGIGVNMISIEELFKLKATGGL